jgi:hypothetical protein
MITAVVVYLASVLLIFLVLYFVRGHRSRLWRRTVPQQMGYSPLPHLTRVKSWDEQPIPSTPGEGQRQHYRNAA